MSPRARPHVFAVLCVAAVLRTPAGRADEKEKPIPVREEPVVTPDKLLLPLDEVIKLTGDRVAKNPKDAFALAYLGWLHVRKAREDGDLTAYDRAGECYKRLIELDPKSVSGRAGMAVVLAARHKFAESLELARSAYRDNPEEHGLLASIADALQERGELAEAEKALDEWEKKDPGAAAQSRRARLAELRGRPDEALKWMERADREESARAMSKEARAWYKLRLGEMHFNAGRLKEAAAQAETALEWHPRYAQALALLGRVRAAEGKADDAIKLYTRAVSIAPDLTMLAELGDLHARAGNEFLAKINHDKLVATAAKDPAHDRDLARFYADHDREPARALELAERDLKVRQDPYAYDTLAWALYRNGRYADAGKAMAEALKAGARDAAVLYHAGMIHYRLKEPDRAGRYLREALAANPYFSAVAAKEARTTLAALDEPRR
jgi:tetratricopeptide (TPR) repeat protein